MPSEFDFGRRSYDPTVPGDAVLDDVVRDWLQHLVVLALRQKMVAGATGNKAVAEVLGVVQGHFVKKLSGRQSLTFEDLALLMTAFGPDVFPTLQQEVELFPPSCRDRLVWEALNGMRVPKLIS